MTTKRFTGQYHESTLPGGEGLSHYGSRWYDARLGRFLSADTIVSGAGNPQAFNRYSYVLNRPLVMIDPTGHAGIGGPYLTPGNGGGSGQRPGTALVVTCAGIGCIGGSGSTIYLPIVSNQQYRPPAVAYNNQPACPGLAPEELAKLLEQV